MIATLSCALFNYLGQQYQVIRSPHKWNIAAWPLKVLYITSCIIWFTPWFLLNILNAFQLRVAVMEQKARTHEKPWRHRENVPCVHRKTRKRLDPEPSYCKPTQPRAAPPCLPSMFLETKHIQILFYLTYLHCANGNQKQYSYWLRSKLNFSLCMDMWLFDVMTETPYQYFKKSSHQQLKFEMSTSSFLRDLNAVKYASIVKLNYMVRGLADSQLAYSWCQRLKWNICTFLFLLKVTFLSLNLQDTVWQYSGMTLGLKHVTYIYMVAVAFSLGYILDWI